MLCPSTPAAPSFASTLVQASSSVSDAYTLSINVYHLPPLPPLSSADSMRSVHTSASTQSQLRLGDGVSAPCLASALPVLLCLGMVSRIHLPALPSLRRVLLPRPPAVLCQPQQYYAGSDSSPARTRRQGLSACFALPSGHPAPNHVVHPNITISSTSVCPAGCRHPGFVLGPRTRRITTPKRVRYPAGCSFASGCSPPRLPRKLPQSLDAVAFSYMWRDLTWVGLSPPDKATSQTHDPPLTRGMTTEGLFEFQYHRVDREAVARP